MHKGARGLWATDSLSEGVKKDQLVLLRRGRTPIRFLAVIRYGWVGLMYSKMLPTYCLLLATHHLLPATCLRRNGTDSEPATSKSTPPPERCLHQPPLGRLSRSKVCRTGPESRRAKLMLTSSSLRVMNLLTMGIGGQSVSASFRGPSSLAERSQKKLCFLRWMN